MPPTATGTLALSAAILLVAAVSMAPQATADDGRATERDVEALTAQLNTLQDPDGQFSTWDPNNMDVCYWRFIYCNQSYRVIQVDLMELNLSGHLVPELATMDKLKHLRIPGNSIQGSIPPEYGDLENLLSLDFFQSNLSGPIPRSLGRLKSLEFLRLEENHLTGPIPSELTALPDLLVAFANNPRLRGPQLQLNGVGVYDTDC